MGRKLPKGNSINTFHQNSLDVSICAGKFLAGAFKHPHYVIEFRAVSTSKSQGKIYSSCQNWVAKRSM